MQYHPVRTHVVYDSEENVYKLFTDDGLKRTNYHPTQTFDSRKEAEAWIASDQKVTPPVWIINFNNRTYKQYIKGCGKYPKGNFLVCRSEEQAIDLLSEVKTA